MPNNSLAYSSLVEEQKKLFPNENNDCTVKALAIAAEISYSKAHAILKNRGRKNRQGFKTEIVIEELLGMGKAVKEVTQLIVGSIKTVRAFQERGFKDKYLIRVEGHVLCSKDGQIHDWTNGRCHRIKNVWRVE